MGIYLVSVWLGVGAASLILRRSFGARRTTRADRPAAGLFLLAVMCGVLSVLIADPWGSAFVWLTMGLVNVALGLTGIAGSAAVLGGVGLVATLAALALALLRSFGSLPVIAAAGVVCTGAALLAPGRSAHAGREALEGR